MCGKCCSVVTSPSSYSELQELAKSGDERAIDFLELFVPYSSIEDAKKVFEQTVENILKISNQPVENITFYRCKNLLPDNMCKIYKERREVCIRFPSSPWAVVPPGCGYENWLADKRNEIIQKVREQKEILPQFESDLQKDISDEEKARLKFVIDSIKNTIKIYEKYGSADW